MAIFLVELESHHPSWLVGPQKINPWISHGGLHILVSNMTCTVHHIWDVILPIDSCFSRWLLHHQPGWLREVGTCWEHRCPFPRGWLPSGKHTKSYWSWPFFWLNWSPITHHDWWDPKKLIHGFPMVGFAYWCQTWLVLSIIYGMSSFPLTHVFQDGYCTTNQDGFAKLGNVGNIDVLSH